MSQGLPWPPPGSRVIRIMTHRFMHLAGLLAAVCLQAHEPVLRARTPIRFPDLPGYVTLKADLHIHTVFSDGQVWPTVRVEEAWREGLDALAITDHLEYQPHKGDVSTNHNRAVDLAKPTAANLELLFFRGSEITRSMPPGHLNGIFLTNSMELALTNWHDSVAAAHRQRAFIFWNHPGWDAQTTNGIVLWYPQHSQLLEEGMLHGIEVINSGDYYPEAHRWALEKKLTMLSNSDIHSPIQFEYSLQTGGHRPLTLIFARERSPEAVREALFNRQTVAFSGDRLVGEERFLLPLFQRSLRWSKTKFTVTGKQTVALQIANDTDIDYRLERAGLTDKLGSPERVTLPAGKTVLFNVHGKSDTAIGTETVKLPYRVLNVLSGPSEPLAVTLDLEVTFVPKPAK